MGVDGWQSRGIDCNFSRFEEQKIWTLKSSNKSRTFGSQEAENVKLRPRLCGECSCSCVLCSLVLLAEYERIIDSYCICFCSLLIPLVRGQSNISGTAGCIYTVSRSMSSAELRIIHRQQISTRSFILSSLISPLPSYYSYLSGSRL